MDVRPNLSGPRSSFLSGDGEMANRTAAHPWQDGPLGPIAGWPQSLKSFVSLVMESPIAMIVLWGPELIQIYNDAFIVTCGDKHPQGLGRPHRTVWPEVWEFNKPIFDAVERGETRSFVGQPLTINRGNGPEEAWFDVSYSPVRDEAGEIGGALVVVVETTKQVQADQCLIADRDRQRKLFDQAPGFTCILTGPNHVFEFANSAYAQLVGRTDLIGRTVREGLPDIAGQGFYELLDTVYATGERFIAKHVPISFQAKTDRPTEQRYLDFVYEPILDELGHITGVFVQGNDVTETHLAQVALFESEVRVRAALAMARLGTFDWDQNTGEVVLDDRSREIFGLGPDEGRRQEDVFGRIHPDDFPRIHALAQASGRDRTRLHVEYRIVLPDGSERIVASTNEAVPPYDVGADRLVGVFADVTDERRAEQALQRLNSDLEAEVEARLEELSGVEAHLRQAQKMEAVGQLTGGIAHDFNNMLTGVIGGLDILKRRLALGQYDDLDRFIDLARQSGERAADLTHRLLAFSRRQSLVARRLELDAVIDGMQDLLQRTLGENINLVLALAEDTWAVRSDSGQVENTLLNLAINARDAMPDGGDLTIETANVSVDAADNHPDLAPGDYVRISVGDQGEGMSPANLARAFEPFFTTKPIGEGTGLGLSMIYGFAKQSHGHAEILSVRGSGTTVSVWLPRAAEVALDNVVPITSGLSAAVAGATVMVVEDEPSVRELIAEVLTELGYAIIEAASGDAALPVLRSNRQIDLLVTDVGLPGMNGRQLADVARALRPGMKVLFVTGYAEQAANRDDFLDDGMAIVAKPFTIDALAVQIRSMISGEPTVGLA